MRKIMILACVVIILMLSGCELPSGRGPKSGKAELVPFKKGINPVYILTKKGLTVIDSKTDKIVTEGYKLKYFNLSEIEVFYKDKLFTSYGGSDFPNTKANTYLWNLRNGSYEYIFDAPVYALRKQDNYIYGLSDTSGDGLNFIYNIKTDKFTKGVSGAKEPMNLLGIVLMPQKGKHLLLGNMESIELRSINAKTIISKRKIFNINSLVAENTKVVLFGRGDVKVIDLVTDSLKKLPIKVSDFYTAFYAFGKLFIGIAPGYSEIEDIDDDFNNIERTTDYSVYRLSDGKLLKKMKMDLQANNTIKIDNLLIFLDGKQKGKALNLKTAKIENATVIAPRSILQDGKIYSVSGNKVDVRRKFKILKTIKLDSQHIDKYEDNTSVFNPSIFASDASGNNFKIIDE